MGEADALKYRIEAKANAEQKRLDGLWRGGRKGQGTSEVEVVKLKGLAEAEAKEKLAEAFEKFGQAAVLDIMVKIEETLVTKANRLLPNKKLKIMI